MAHLPKGQGVVPMPPFLGWLASNIPAVYDNTMSYYEELTSLIKYLQDSVVPALNADSEAITVLSNFVEHYFDNLDVQEEINNKLDQMAEDGTLQEIIGEYLNATAVWGFDTVADMKASTNLINGSYARTLGYGAKNDGGASLYKIRTITNDDVVDETHIIEMADDTLIAELINPFEIYPDNFTGSTDTAKMQNAIDYAVAKYNEGQPVIIRLNRLYDITSSLDIETNITRGQFTFATTNGGGFILNSNILLFTTAKSYVSDITFDKITFKGTNNNGSCIMESPKFLNIKFLGCTFKDVDQCVRSTTYIQAYTFDNCLITGGQNHFIEFAGAYYLNVTNCTVEHRRDSYFIKQNYSTSTVYNKMFEVTVNNNIIEGFSGATSGFIYIVYYELLNIINNYFENLVNIIVHDAKQISGVLNIKNNRLYQNPNSMTGLDSSGMMVMKPYTTNVVRMGQINFEGNFIYNTYAIYFDDMTQINYAPGQSAYNILHYRGNYVNSAITASYYVDNRTSNAPFNLLPVFSNPNAGSSKYYRCFWDIANKINWNETITVDGVDYAVKYVFQNAKMNVYQSRTVSLTTSPSWVKFYYGFDIYRDDMFSVSCSTSNCQINYFLRQGDPESKFFALNAQAKTETGNKDLNVAIELVGLQG